ncbi:MAG: flagellar motor protein MotB [Myxococcota bacterium]
MSQDATDAHGQGPIIIKKKVVQGHGHHGGAWKVAYADMVTALMALFIVLWILSQSDEVKQSVAGYFQDPVGFVEGGRASLLEGAGPATEAEGSEDTDVAPTDAQREEARLRAEARAIRRAIDRIPAIEKYREQIELSVTPEGLRINLLETQETPLFQRGGTELNPDAVEVLETIGRAIKEAGNAIVIEGHTDSTPFSEGSGRTNWELSTGRAHTARRVFEAVGISEERILEVRGFADRQLYNPLDPEDSHNRRVSVTLLSDEALSARQKVPEETLIPWMRDGS